jgi:hypothetical protein
MNGFARAFHVALLAALVLLPLPGEARAVNPSADAVAYATGTCNPDTGTSTYTVIESAALRPLHDVDVLFETTGGPGTWSGGQSWSQAGAFWQSGVELPAGPAGATGTVACAGASHWFEYDIYYVPRPRLAPGPSGFYGTLEGPGWSNSIGFTAGERAYYGLYLEVDGPSLVVRFDGQTYVLQRGDHRVDLGYLAVGPHDIELDGTPAGRSEYYLQLMEQPVTLSDLANTVHYVRGGASIPLGITLSSDARVHSEAIDNSDHRVVQRVDSPTPLGPGHQEFTWSARDNSGAPLPDGGYSLYLSARNNYGSSGTSETQVIVDSEPPKFSFGLPTAWIGLMQPAIVPLEVGVLDSFGQGTLTIDDGPPITMGKYYLSYLPRGGWEPGQHKATVVAVDLAGNVGRESITFTVPPRPPTPEPYIRPDCSTLGIKTAVRNSRPLNSALRRVGKDPHGDLFRHFLIGGRSCSDVTTDNTPELVVLLREQRGPKTVLAIFRRQGKGWALAFQDAKHRIDKIGQLFYDITEDLHEGGTIRVHWNGSRFILRSG